MLLVCARIAKADPIIDRVMDRQNFTFSPQIEISGPIYQSENAQEYMKETLQIVLSEAHILANDYLLAGDRFAYWSFIMGALMVPLHEGGYLHFRSIPNSKKACLDNSNSGRIFNKAKSTKEVFRSYFKLPNDDLAIFPSCKTLESEINLNQILHGGDGSDIGMMQVNMRFHEKGYILFGGYQDVRSTVNYGLNFYKKGFDYVYRNSSAFPCVKNNKRIDQKKLIHAAWAGMYNSGNLNESCRWTREKNEWQANDDAFEINLRKLYSFVNIKKLMLYFPFPTDEATLFSTVVEVGSKATEKKSDLITSYLESGIVPAAANADDIGSETEGTIIFPKTGQTIVELNVRAALPNGYTLAPLTGKVLRANQDFTVIAEAKVGANRWYKISSPYEGWVSAYYVRLK